LVKCPEGRERLVRGFLLGKMADAGEYYEFASPYVGGKAAGIR